MTRSSSEALEAITPGGSSFISPGRATILYCYGIPNSNLHQGAVKIGGTTMATTASLEDVIGSCVRVGGHLYTGEEVEKAARSRITAQTNTAGIPWELHWAFLAVTPREKNSSAEGESGSVGAVASREDCSYRSFWDQEFHGFLDRHGVERVRPDKNGKAREWFSTTPEQALSLLQYFQTGEVEHLQGAVGVNARGGSTPAPVLRDEQRECVDLMKKKLRGGSADSPKRFLCDGIMRFGKTLVALTLVKEGKGFNKVLILTHRPQVLTSWHDDFNKVGMVEKEYTFGSRTRGSTFQELKGREKFIYFASLQDARGSFAKPLDTTDATASTKHNHEKALEMSKEFYSKNEDLFRQEWDLIIVDEGHEGTLTELAGMVKDNLHSPHWLTLSGTPFNIMDGYESDMVYSWDYLSERKAVERYRAQFPGESGPYDSLPELVQFVYDLTETFSRGEYKEITPDGVSFNFKRFLETVGDTEEELEFSNQRDVNDLLNLITKDRRFDGDERNFPFQNAAMKNELAHTLWMLPSVDACIAMQKLMAEHSYFSTFTVINVAGDNFDGVDALATVKKAIAENPYTITLSVGRLTTGVTVPEWTGVFLLSNIRSATTYMQTIFRCKSGGTLPDGRVKTKGYVFDFSPQRCLEMTARVAAASVSNSLKKAILSGEAGGDEGDFEDALEEQLRYAPVYHPVITDDGAGFKPYDSKMLMRRVMGALARETYKSGFMTTSLFDQGMIRDALQDEAAVERLNFLRSSVGTQRATKANPVVLHDSGVSEQVRELGKKRREQVPRGELGEWSEAKKALEKERRDVGNVISVLRALSARIPLMVFAQELELFRGKGQLVAGGAAVQEDEASTVDAVATATSADSGDSLGGDTSTADVDAPTYAMPADAAISTFTGWPGNTGESALDTPTDEVVSREAKRARRLLLQERMRERGEFNQYNLTRLIDDDSWEQFMPRQVSKELWDEVYSHFFHPMMFELSCHQVISHVVEAMEKSPLERVPYIAEIFSTFRNPDKETVLTPWRVVVKQVTETLGGLRWVDMQGNWRASDGEYRPFEEIKVDPSLGFQPEWVSQGDELDEFYGDHRSTAIDLNSKTALYPLFMAASFYHRQVEEGALKFFSEDELWSRVVERQVFVNCRVEYSRAIARRVLTGFHGDAVLNSSVVDVIEVSKHLGRMKLKDEQVQVLWRYVFNPSAFDSTEDRVRDIMTMDRKGVLALLEDVASVEVDRFGAVVSNPPYQDNVGGDTNTGRAVPMWPMFIALANATSKRASFVTPGRWMRGGAGTGLSDIRNFLLTSGNLHRFIIFQDKDLFEGVGIGEMTIQSLNFERSSDYILQGKWVNGSIVESRFTPSDTLDIFVAPRDTEIVEPILSVGYPSVEKKLWVGGVSNLTEKKAAVESPTRKNNHELRGPRIYREPDYFICADEKKVNVEYVKIYFLAKAMTVGERFLPIDEFKKNKMNEARVFSSWKSIFSKTGAYSLYRNLGPLGEKNTITVDSWVCRSFDSLIEVENYNSYLQTYFYRYLVNVRATSHNALANVHRWVPDLADVKNPRTGKIGYESDWTDDDLKILFKDVLTEEDWHYIKATAIAADGGRGDYEAGYELPKPYNWDELHPGEAWNGKRHSLTLEDVNEE